MHDNKGRGRRRLKNPTAKESLFSIGEHFYALESLLIENEGEIDETLVQWLNEYEAKEAEKVDAYCYLVQKFEEISAEAKRLTEGTTAETLPENFVKVYREPDMNALRDAVLGGDDQALQFARILPRGTHLRIK